MNYAKKIKEYREKALITQVELAKILNVGVSNISRWEQGHFEPTMETKRKFRKLFEESGIKVEDNE